MAVTDTLSLAVTKRMAALHDQKLVETLASVDAGIAQREAEAIEQKEDAEAAMPVAAEGSPGIGAPTQDIDDGDDEIAHTD